MIDPAYPHRQRSGVQHHGMSKREVFAAAALTGLLSADSHMLTLADAAKKKGIPLQQLVAEQCYMHADAMVKAGQ